MGTEGEDNINMGTGAEDDINLKINGEESSVDVVSLVDKKDISKEDCLKLVQSICKKLAIDGDEMMFMTVNLTQKTTTCVGSQLGVNFLNHKPHISKEDHPDNPNISQMFQQFLEDHYEISNICDDKQIPFSPASSVIMESPSYTPFSSPRPYKAVKLPSSKSGKLLTPKIEVMESDFDGNSTATDSQEDDNQLSLESYVNSLPLTEQSFLIGSPKDQAIQQVINNNPITNQGVLARLLSPSIQGLQAFQRFQSPTIPNSSAVPVFQPPVIQNSANFTGFRSPANQTTAELLSQTNQNEFHSPTTLNIRSVLARLLTPSKHQMNATQSPTSVPAFPTPTSFQSIKPQTAQNQSSPVPTPISLHPIQLQQVSNQSEPVNSFTPVQPTSETGGEKQSTGGKRGRGRPKGSFKRVEVPMESETDETENEGEKTDKTVTLRSGRKVRVPSWRKDILEESLKINRRKLEEITDIQIKQERISPTFPETPEDDQDEDVRVEFDFDILAELKKESDLEPDQSDDSSWCGTVHLTSGDDSTPNRVPFKFTFPVEKKQKLEEKENDAVKVVQNEDVEISYDNTLSSLGLARKRARTINRCPDFTGRGHIWRCEDGRFNYYQMYTVQNISWGRQFTCKICKRVMQGNESLKTHCFTHEAFNKLHPVCQACDRVFDNHQALEDHIGLHEKLYSCHTCEVKFVSKLALIQHLNWVHKEMYSCPRCDKTFTSSKDLSNHLEECFDEKALVTRGGVKHLTEDWIGIKEDGKVTFKCRSCKDVFETVEEYNKHMLQHKSKFVQKLNEKLEKSMSTEKPSTDVDDKSTTCELCNKIFETPVHLAKHKKAKHKKDQDDDEDTDEDVSPDAYKCSSCNIHFDSAVAFSHHCMKYHPDNPMISLEDDTDFPCNLCSKRMRTKEGYDTHIKMHDNMMKKQCKMCGTFLHQEASIDLHCCVKEDSEFTCEKCSLCFYNQGFLAGHQHHVHGKPLEDIKVKDNDTGQPICNICGKIFKKASDLEGHRSIHTGELPFVCHLCHKSFRLRSTLKTHLMTHRDFHEFMCEVCGRTFKLIESLRLHRRLHNKTCYFKCKHCPREFRAYDGLKYHMLQCHKDEVKGKKLKIYKCEHCNKDMATHQQYVRHVSIHTNEKPLQCDQCGTRWATISQLNAHKKKHNAENLKFACDVCNIRFPILSKLKRHVKTAKHIDNCRIQTLPIDTVRLEEETGADPPQNTSRIIADVTDIEEKVEIMFYEINLPEDENSLGEKTSMIYDISVVPENQNGALFEASASNGAGTDLQVAANMSVVGRSNNSSQLQQTTLNAITGSGNSSSNAELKEAIGTITGNTNSENVNVQIQQTVVEAMAQTMNSDNVSSSQVDKSVVSTVKSNVNSNSVSEVSLVRASAVTQGIDHMAKIGAVAVKLNAEVDRISAVTNTDKYNTDLQLTQSYDTTSDTENTDLISTEGSATEVDS
ncbi:KRAB [Mytilus coruscus]|uniref:KRAB n=1 Tax=Mytilus coruscus TaxID=42192 RepID=A0A6J8BSM5_MYTCO|nr:KRAB [Mytilus coruscus]